MAFSVRLLTRLGRWEGRSAKRLSALALELPLLTVKALVDKVPSAATPKKELRALSATPARGTLESCLASPGSHYPVTTTHQKGTFRRASPAHPPTKAWADDRDLVLFTVGQDLLAVCAYVLTASSSRNDTRAGVMLSCSTTRAAASRPDEIFTTTFSRRHPRQGALPRIASHASAI